MLVDTPPTDANRFVRGRTPTQSVGRCVPGGLRSWAEGVKPASRSVGHGPGEGQGGGRARSISSDHLVAGGGSRGPHRDGSAGRHPEVAAGSELG